MGRFFWVLLAAGGLLSCEAELLARSRPEFRVQPRELVYGPTGLSLPKRLELVVMNTGRAPYQVLAATIEGPGLQLEPFAPFKLDSGGSRALGVVFAPSAEGEVHGVLHLETDTVSAGTDGIANIPFRGEGVKAYVVLDPIRLDFGNLELGHERSLELNAHNPTAAPAPLRYRISGVDAAMFTSPSAGQNLELKPGEHRKLPIVFHADRLFAAAAEVTLDECGGCEQRSVALEGFTINSVVEITPSRIDFGRVPLGARAEARVVVVNQGTEPLDFQGVEWRDPASPYSFDCPPAGPLAPGGRLEFKVAFAPVSTASVPVAFLQVKVRASNTVAGGWPMLPVKAEVGDSCVVALPRSLDFGIVPEGMTATRRIDLLNRCGSDVVVSDLEVAIFSGGFFGLAKPTQALPIAAGGKESVLVSFIPKPGSAQSTAKLSFKAQQGSALSYGEVALKGETTTFAPCLYTVSPSAVDFGGVAVGSEVTLGTAIRNSGASACFLSGAGLVAGSDPEFSSQGLDSRVLAPGESAVLSVSFKPGAVGTFNALGEAFLNGAAGHPTVAFSGTGVQGCLQLLPSNLLFGSTKLSCPARTRTVTAINNCAGPVELVGAGIASATTSEFSIFGAPPLPLSLAAGTQTTFSVRYAPVDEGDDAAGFFVELGAGQRQTIGLAGRGVDGLLQTDRFFQEGLPKVDLLFVVDNSGSMMEEQAGLAQNFAAVLSAAQASGVDYHIAVTTTGIEPAPGGWAICPGGAEGGEAGRLFPADGSSPRVITPVTPNAAQVFAANVQVGWCHWDEQGLEAAYRALSTPLVNATDDASTVMPNDGNAGFLRAGAKLAIIALSDEDDSSPQQVGFYSAFFKSLKGGDPALLSFSSIVGPADLTTCPTAAGAGSRYLQLSQETGGISENICTQNWAGSLQNLSANAFGPRSRFPLSEQPLVTSEISVQVNGLPVTSGWSYEPLTNTVVFAPGQAPAAGSVVDVTYPLGC